MNTLAEAAEEVVDHLVAEDLPDVEVFVKQGRSRHFEWTPFAESCDSAEESGWAVRAGDDRKSFHYAATGMPRVDASWPPADGLGIRLPEAWPVSAYRPRPGKEAPLLPEHLGLEILTGFAAAMQELGADVEQLSLRDGLSWQTIVNSRGVRATHRNRLARWESTVLPRPFASRALRLEASAADGREIDLDALVETARMRLEQMRAGPLAAPVSGRLLIAAEVLADVLALLAPLFLGATADIADLVARRAQRIAAPGCTLVDDGRLAGGLLEAPVDGEGVPTGRRVLVDRGRFVEPILAWWESEAPIGCCVRHSWREIPRPAPTHFFLQPGAGVTFAELIGDGSSEWLVTCGEGNGRLHTASGRFVLPVAGYRLEQGQSVEPFTGAALVGVVGDLLHGLVALADDLAFVSRGGEIGAPGALVEGLALVPLG